MKGYTDSMDRPINLSPQVEASLQTNGGPLEVTGQQGRYIVMRLDVYNALLGLGDDDDEAEALASARRGLADVDAGRTQSIDQVFARLQSRYAS